MPSPPGLPVRLVVLAVLLLPLTAAGSPAYATDAAEIPFNTAKILEFHNIERAARGIGALARDPRMDQHAQQLAETLAAAGKLQHSPTYAITIGYSSGAQNLVFRAPSLNASQAHYSWMTSDNHRRNLLNPGFTHAGIGIACSQASGRAYPVAVVDFGGHGGPPPQPPQNPISVQANALQGHGIACNGSSAPPPPPPPAPAPVVAPPPPPPPAPIIAQAAIPKVAPVKPVPAPAPAPEAAPVEAAPIEGVPEPLPEHAPEPPVPNDQVAEVPVIDPSPAAQTADPATAGLIAFVIGSTAALVVAGAGGGYWYRRSLARPGSR